MGEKYFNLKLESEDVYGHIIRLDNDELTDYIHSFSDEEDNLQLELVERGTEKKPAIYKVIIPNMEFSAGACAPSLAVNSGPGWNRNGKKVVRLTLDKEVLRVAEGQENIFVDEISKSKADEIKEKEFLWSMQQLYIAGL